MFSCRQMDGQTDMIKLIAAFLNYVNAPTYSYDVMRQQPKATLQHSQSQYAINFAFQQKGGNSKNSALRALTAQVKYNFRLEISVEHLDITATQTTRLGITSKCKL